MVLSRVNRIDSNDVGEDLLHDRDVSRTLRGIGQGIGVFSVRICATIGNVVLLVSDALQIANRSGLVHGFAKTGALGCVAGIDLQLRAIVGVEEVLAIDFDFRDSIVTLSKRTGQCGRCQSDVRQSR